jgi:hypothetical protein
MLLRQRREKEHLQCRQWPAQGTKDQNDFLIARKGQSFSLNWTRENFSNSAY